jgi:fructosamine-3-kinase
VERLSGGNLSQVLLLRRIDGRCTVAKGAPGVATEATMLRSIAGAGVPAPAVEGEHEGVLLLEYIENDRVFSPHAWASIGEAVRRLHERTGDSYGWDADYQIDTVALDNRRGTDWPRFWGEQRLMATAALLDRPWRERIEALSARLGELLPPSPRPAQLHGDLWSGNILVNNGILAALIDPACYFADAEVDLAMLTLFDTPPEEFWAAYGPLEPGWGERRIIYQLFPALMHLRLFGLAYAPVADRLLAGLEA